ncbi:Sec1-like snare protein [Exidia glandulosa HHB12029]|uniref:Sec1-like snare protein n=1 Tax=Exidia glandulosa HHB12029 TaxID=1314781 RepID=A0A165KHR3_EXIGL|nr:Sec1-like snare protein [Exidia glandulosa HHB12029]
MPASLIQIVRKRFLDTIKSVNPPGRWKILVVDEHSQRLLSSVLRTFDILEENVTQIELLNQNRPPQPNLEAVYIVMSTGPNVDRIIADFTGKQQYAAAHLFFVDGLPEVLFKQIAASAAEPYLRQLVELYLNIWAIESQAWSVKLPSMFFTAYGPPRTTMAQQGGRARLIEDLRFVARNILNVCVTLEELPLIRYYRGPALGPLSIPKGRNEPEQPQSSRWRTALGGRGDMPDEDNLCKLLAMMVQDELDDYKKGNPDYPPATGRQQAVLFITDRSLDLAAPLLHEFTYQAMCNDLLPIQDGTKYRYKFQSSEGVFEDMDATLSDADTVWTSLRHMHMREAIDKLMADFNKFITENAEFSGNGAATLNDMKDMLANLPQYQEQREKFSLHLNMAQECMDLFQKQQLPVIGMVEQNCATGVTAENKTPKTLVEEMVPLLDGRDVSNANKLRVMALYILYREGVPTEDLRRLFQHARLTQKEQDAITALGLLGARLTRQPGDRDRGKKLKQKNSTDDEYELSRYRPLVHTMLEEHCSGKLDSSLFPYVREPPPPAAAGALTARAAPLPVTSLRSAKPSWHKAPRAGGPAEQKQRLLVFMAGGMTYSEMRAAYTLTESLGRDIYIGSTHTWYPDWFIEDLKTLEKSGLGSATLPQGVANTGPPEPVHPQSYYDKKYFTRDAPPPPPPPAQSLAPAAAVQRPQQTLTPQPSTQRTSVASDSGSANKEKEKSRKRDWFKF